MRESNYTFPAHNRAVISITHLLYDRRALDTNSSLALLNNLTSLTYLTSTSPRIRELLTIDGGLERLLDILRDSTLPQEPVVPDLWGLNGPCTARTIPVDRGVALRHSLAFQCVVNIGVRGSEGIRTRVVQAGALDLVAQILESWLKKHGVAIFSSPLGSQMAVDAQAAGIPIAGAAPEQRRHHRHRTSRSHAAGVGASSQVAAAVLPSPASPTGGAARPSGRLGQLVATIRDLVEFRQAGGDAVPPRVTRTDADAAAGVDVDMDAADAEADVETDGASVGPEDGSTMDVDEARDDRPERAGPSAPPVSASATATTPRARHHVLPMPMPIAIPARASAARAESQTPLSQASSAAASVSSEEPTALPRARSENSLATEAAEPITRPASGLAARLPQLADDQVSNVSNQSNQSSPMGTPNRIENVEGMRARRGTIIGRPVNINLVPRNERRPFDTDASEASDAAQETDLATATIQAGIAAANAQAAQANEMGGQLGAPLPTGDEPGIVEGDDAQVDEPDPEALAAEQARLDLEAGAPPGQPGAAQTPRVAPTARAQRQLGANPAAVEQQAQIIIANGAPRAFQDLASYVGISSLLHPDTDHYSDDSILLALQLLAYLSKYPHVRAAFHHPRRPMHPTFDYADVVLPERPASSETPNIFSLVERFTFRASPADPVMFRIPQEIQYWAGVIMRNACRKDDAQGGIRQCANMSCGRWEHYPREFAKCRRCRKAKYCSKECQSRAWSEGHRFWCNVRSEHEPSADGPPGAPPRDGRPPRDADDDDDIDMDDPRAATGAGPAAAAGPGRTHRAAAPAGHHRGHAGAAPPAALLDATRPGSPPAELDRESVYDRLLRSAGIDPDPAPRPPVGAALADQAFAALLHALPRTDRAAPPAAPPQPATPRAQPSTPPPPPARRRAHAHAHAHAHQPHVHRASPLSQSTVMRPSASGAGASGAAWPGQSDGERVAPAPRGSASDGRPAGAFGGAAAVDDGNDGHDGHDGHDGDDGDDGARETEADDAADEPGPSTPRSKWAERASADPAVPRAHDKVLPAHAHAQHTPHAPHASLSAVGNRATHA